MFTVFDRDALTAVKDGSRVYRSGFNSSGKFNGNGVNAVHEDFETNMASNIEQWTSPSKPHYTDEIPPFDVTITFLNEYGHSSQMSIYGVEITNEGMGLSIDDITTQKACTFVARGLNDMGSTQHQKE